ncbi:hypothetical protein [[Eubacterium] hominis]|uniref:hypothetical protein n=2 Tax=Bacillota TaxID=1239 RepID=UPI0015BA4242
MGFKESEDKKMKYVLMQAPKKPEEYSSQIVIVDNSTHIGKKKIESLIYDGYKFAGTIESDLRVQQLKSGFEFDLTKKIDDANEIIKNINKLSEELI